jgi:ferredoxin
MGHLSNLKDEYRALQQRHDQGPAALPATPAILEALELIYSPEEARLAALLPWRPVSAAWVARRSGETEAAARALLERMAGRGLVFDLVNRETGEARYVLAPPLVGFIEFTLMRVRSDIDQPRVAKLLEEYLHGDRTFAEAMFAPGDGQLGRTLVNEDTLSEADRCEVVGYERATQVIQAAGGGALSLCYCRHAGEHTGHPCSHALDNCMSLDPAAEYTVRHGHGRRAEVPELLEVLAAAREAGLVQIVDNVQHRPSYLCHCCGCHCGQLRAITDFGLKGAVRTSNRIAAVDAAHCVGCGKCARRCPIAAIRLVPLPQHGGKPARLRSEVDESVCLGCGVCAAACTKGALSMPARAERVLTPVSTLERILIRAIEKGQVHHLLFGSEETASMAFLHRFVGAVERLSPVHHLVVSDAVKSRFVAWMASKATRRKPAPAPT